MLLDPTTFHAGETVTWSLSPSLFSKDTQDLLGEDGARLKLGIANAGGGVAITGDLDGGVWTLKLTVAVSETLTAGSYAYQLIAEVVEDEAITHRRVEAVGYLQVLPLGDGSVAVDHRTPDEKILDAIIAVMEGHATTDQAAVSVDGTSISRMAWSELIAARNDVQRRVDFKRGRSRRTVTRL